MGRDFFKALMEVYPAGEFAYGALEQAFAEWENFVANGKEINGELLLLAISGSRDNLRLSLELIRAQQRMVIEERCEVPVISAELWTRALALFGGADGWRNFEEMARFGPSVILDYAGEIVEASLVYSEHLEKELKRLLEEQRKEEMKSVHELKGAAAQFRRCAGLSAALSNFRASA